MPRKMATLRLTAFKGGNPRLQANPNVVVMGTALFFKIRIVKVRLRILDWSGLNRRLDCNDVINN